jgi:hypothetical protein
VKNTTILGCYGNVKVVMYSNYTNVTNLQQAANPSRMEADATFRYYYLFDLLFLRHLRVVIINYQCIVWYHWYRDYYYITIIMNAYQVPVSRQLHVCVIIQSLSSVQANPLYVITEPPVLSSSRARHSTWMSNIVVPTLTSYLRCTTNGRTFLLARHHKWCCRHP